MDTEIDLNLRNRHIFCQALPLPVIRHAKKIRAPSRTDPASHHRERYQSAGDEAGF